MEAKPVKNASSLLLFSGYNELETGLLSYQYTHPYLFYDRSKISEQIVWVWNNELLKNHIYELRGEELKEGRSWRL